MATEEQRWHGRQKARRAFMGAFLGVLILLGGAAVFFASNNADTPEAVQPLPDITDIRPTTIPDTPPPVPLPDTVPLPSGENPPVPPT